MTTAPNPYAEDLGSRDPREALGDTPQRIRVIVRRLGADRMERRYAPGKWTVRQVLVHLAQVELMLQTRIRLAITVPDFVVQPFEQDVLLALESSTAVGASDALEAYLSLRRLSLPLLRSLTGDQLSRPVRHPQLGAIDVRWMLAMLAGHDLRHFRQLDGMAAA